MYASNTKFRTGLSQLTPQRTGILLVAAQHERVLGRRNMQGSTASSSFSTNIGSRETLTALTPNCAAMVRACVLQCMAASGLHCVASSTSQATSTVFGGAPHGRSRSLSASRSLATNVK
jgi:hypothetical protein